MSAIPGKFIREKSDHRRRDIAAPQSCEFSKDMALLLSHSVFR
jgi:hypothetical protein